MHQFEIGGVLPDGPILSLWGGEKAEAKETRQEAQAPAGCEPISRAVDSGDDQSQREIKKAERQGLSAFKTDLFS